MYNLLRLYLRFLLCLIYQEMPHCCPGPNNPFVVTLIHYIGHYYSPLISSGSAWCPFFLNVSICFSHDFEFQAFLLCFATVTTIYNQRAQLPYMVRSPEFPAWINLTSSESFDISRMVSYLYMFVRNLQVCSTTHLDTAKVGSFASWKLSVYGIMVSSFLYL